MPFPDVVDAIVDGQTTERAAQVIGPQRITVGPAWVNVKSDQWGGTFDGVTDVAAALQAAENAAQTAGATVYYPPAVYPLSTALNVYGKVRHLGAGIENTILKLRTGASTTTPLIQTLNFATLAAGGGGAGAGTSTGGEANFMFDSMTLDGNKAGVASTVPVIRLYGRDFTIKDVRVRNGNNVGLYSEWCASLPSPGNDSMMAFLSNLKAHDNGAHGVHWNGPHDSMWALGEIYNNNTSTGAFDGVFADTNGNGLCLLGVHSWGLTQNYAVRFKTTGCVFGSGCVAEGAITAQVGIDGNDCTVLGFIYGAGATVPVGVVIGVTGSRVGTYVKAKINNCNSGAVAFTNDGISTVDVHVFATGGTPFTGTINPLSRVDALVNGVAGSNYQFPGALRIQGGNALQLSNAANSSFASLSFDGTKASLTWPFETASGQYLKAGGAFAHTRQTPTEAVLVSGISANLGDVIAVTLTAARLVGAPLNPTVGQRLIFTFVQGGAGAFAVTWNAVFKVTWSNTGNATGARSSISFVWDGTNWNQDAAQAPYV